MFSVSKVILLKEFELKFGDGKKVYYMRDQHIPTWLVRAVLLVSYQVVVIIVTLTFWVVFLIEETFCL